MSDDLDNQNLGACCNSGREGKTVRSLFMVDRSSGDRIIDLVKDQIGGQTRKELKL